MPLCAHAATASRADTAAGQHSAQTCPVVKVAVVSRLCWLTVKAARFAAFALESCRLTLLVQPQRDSRLRVFALCLHVRAGSVFLDPQTLTLVFELAGMACCFAS